jgi:hypothetical protein
MEFLNVIFPILPMCGLLILILLLGIVLNYFWLKYMLRNIRVCPECKTKGTSELKETDEIILSNSVDRRGRKPVRIKETKFIDHYECSACGHSWVRSFIQKDRIRMDDINTR